MMGRVVGLVAVGLVAAGAGAVKIVKTVKRRKEQKAMEKRVEQQKAAAAVKNPSKWATGFKK